MNKLLPGFTAATCVLLAAAAAVAQDNSTMPPPKVLTVSREFLKPGKSGMMHEKTESAFVQALNRAKWPTHYLALDSITGKTRSLFLTGYDSFADWEKDVQAEQKNPSFAAAIDRAGVADGELLSETDTSAWTFNPDQSLNADGDVSHMRYFEIEVFKVKPGHDHDWDEILKMVMAAYQKVPGAHWAAYDNVYGSPGAHAYFIAMKSASEIDHSLATNKDFAAAMGEDGMKRLAELSAVTIESVDDNLFAFNPNMSYAPEDWIKADPEFWKPKAAGAPAKKAPEKPANPQ